ncbi:polysaccharide deacetylase family protein [Flavobacterium sp. '19STA2R22 D10 B1']|uniref:polysaccharide deacetylase family protein n=1 Tax=Flavobacterium aerium TaxID=3037261 RepID=UPI00278C830A|nr:polysaccharide deacetylase family protein [Flavobacterium sp. '19STA2R22 D10 B1']
MCRLYFILILSVILTPVFDQNNHYSNTVFLEKLHSDTDYLTLKEKITKEFTHAIPGHWGEFVKGVDEDLVTQQKIIAFTFDACGGKNADEYDAELIDYLRKEKIPATLFVTGKWIDANYLTFLNLSKDPLFEIENHGLNHKPCSVDGESEYGIHGTKDSSDAFDEVEGNARKIKEITNRRPLFYRSATAYTDEACAKLVKQLGITMISFDVLSGDAVPYVNKKNIVDNVVKNVTPGAIVIMHFNHPKWNTFEAMQDIIPLLRNEGYHFAKLEDFPLRSKK